MTHVHLFTARHHNNNNNNDTGSAAAHDASARHIRSVVVLPVAAVTLCHVKLGASSSCGVTAQPELFELQQRC